MIASLSRRLCLLLAVSTAAFAGESPTDRFVLTSRTPATDFYAFIGPAWSQDRDGGDVWSAALELRGVRSFGSKFVIDVEMAVESNLRYLPDDDSTPLAIGDTALRYSMGFRDLLGIDFVTLTGREVLSEESANFPRTVDRTFQLRAQGGWTRLGYDASITYLDFPDSAQAGNDGTTKSIGYRGQFGVYHLGLDYAWTDRRRVADQEALDFVVMRRSYRGDSCYALVQKGLSDDNDGWYVGVGYEFRINP